MRFFSFEDAVVGNLFIVFRRIVIGMNVKF